MAEMVRPLQRRRVAIAVPAKNEEHQLAACLAALDRAAAGGRASVTIVVVANDCTDGTLDLLRCARLRHARLQWRAVSLMPGYRHAGWARRLAFDAAAASLRDPGDVIASTDADTCVAPDWIARTIDHLDAGADAIAGRALTRRLDRAALGAVALHRLNLLGRYYTALDWLRADLAPEQHDPWPRHFYEGGASIALTLEWYRRIGGAPTPPVAEDRALFAAVRAGVGRVRHPLDVRVFTSSRTEGRAPGGMADAFARWIAQDEDAPLHETYAFPAALDPERARSDDQLSFRTLPAATAAATAAIRARRSAVAPQVQPVLLPPLLPDDLDRRAKGDPQLGDGVVAGLGIVGLAGPVDEKQVAA